MNDLSEQPTGAMASQLPPEWFPDGTAVWVMVQRSDDARWESMIPGFSIAGVGETPEDAVDNAFELLADYLLLCYQDGLTFEQAWRPMGVKATFELARAVAMQTIGPRLHKRRGPRKPAKRRYFRLPVGKSRLGGLILH